MADYNSTRNNLIGSDYYQGLISGFEDYIILPISDTQTVVLQGDFTADNTNDGKDITFNGDRWIISRNSGSGYTSYYDVDYTSNVDCSVRISDPYYCRGNLTDMSVIDTRRDDVVGNFVVTAIGWGVLICVTLRSLLRWCLRSRF